MHKVAGLLLREINQAAALAAVGKQVQPFLIFEALAERSLGKFIDGLALGRPFRPAPDPWPPSITSPPPIPS